PALAAYAVHDLNLLGAAGDCANEPVAPRPCSLVVAEIHEMHRRLSMILRLPCLYIGRIAVLHVSGNRETVGTPAGVSLRRSHPPLSAAPSPASGEGGKSKHPVIDRLMPIQFTLHLWKRIFQPARAIEQHDAIRFRQAAVGERLLVGGV